MALTFGCGSPSGPQGAGDTSTSTTGSGVTGGNEVSSTGDASSETGGASTTTGSVPTTGGDDCETDVEAIQAAAERYQRASGAVGLAVSVGVGDCEPWTQAWGLAEVSTQTELTPDHILRAGSVTKMFTAPLMLELAEEELLTLDDTLQQWEIDLPSASLITIRQLLNHTSGLADYQNNAAFKQLLAAQPDRVWTPQELVAYAVELDPVGKPGQSHAYSNANYILAAMIAEAATGTTYSEALHTHVLDPTGLRHVYVEGDEDWAEPTATGYLAVSGGVPQDATGVYHPSQTWSAGAVVATVDDLRQWVAILLSTDALSPESQDELLDLVPTPGAIHGYGLGLFAIESGAGIVYGHNGAVMGFQAAAFYHPGTGASVAVMQNLISVDGAGNLVADPTLLALEIFAAIPR